ncbi:hypothetical protein BJY21_001907 [Kineosphaera limosa]|uniref:hypothetical protein n=1 Tax=Kineosphaera limosa TaxID=111564 RepID=UPI00068A88F2|nr:hypothetical protein [Kineosphaera limosa]NYE00723.1 hypothetical protein [Kineosphaera limosa]
MPPPASRPSSPENAEDDLAARPWQYPGVPAEGTGVLLGDRFMRLPGSPGDALDELLQAARVAPVAQRTLVLAVGSNASPGVMRRKFAALGVAPVVPFLAVEVEGFAVGHSAHVSRPGFIAATGFRCPGTTTSTFASLLDDDQLACLDATEPNYLRRTLTRAELPVTLAGGTRPEQVSLYDSRWGVLGDATPEPLLPQEERYAWLATHCPPWRRLVPPEADLRATMIRLASDETLREAVRDAWAAKGWSHPSGLASPTSPGHPES